MTKTKRKGLAIAAGVVVGLGLVAVGVKVTAPSCQASPAAQIAALQPGQTFTGSGCYDVSASITPPSGTTVNGGTYTDPATTGTVLFPIFSVRRVSDVTIENVTVQGEHVKGLAPKLVGEAGIKVWSSDNVTLANDTAVNTFGDGLELVADVDKKDDTPVTNLVVSNFTATSPGRCGITLAEVSMATFTTTSISAPATYGLCFEPNEKNAGSGNVSFDGLQMAGRGIAFYEPLSGPVSFSNAHVSGKLILAKLGGLVSFDNGSSFTCERRAPGACVTVESGTLTLAPDTTFGYVAGNSKADQPFTLAEGTGVIVGP